MTGNADVYPLPVSLEGLSNAWLEAALNSWNPGIRLKGSEILDINHGTCTKVRVALELDDAGKAAGIPERVIIKGGFEPHSRDMHYMHKQEVHAYADVLPHTPLRFPACYFAGYDADVRQGIVIMEDLVARGVEFLHPQRPQRPEDVAKRLSRLAAHHAMTYGRSGEFEPGGRFAWATHTADSPHFDALLVPEIWKSYINSARGAAASVCFHDLDWMIRAHRQVNVFAKAQPPVLIHGDTHLGNLYIDIDGEPGFFDSLPHKSAAMQEITYHITNALDVPDRRAHERDLVAHYRYEMASHGIDLPSLDELMHQFGIFLANGYLIFIVNASEFQPEAINTAYTARYSSAMLDHDTIGLLAKLG
ncbi:MAG: ecdysteroid 22-kinase family protein [Novosphingobium sp.]|nr:ecdysteroid 22-kinase family protein [Novosphingobium sp.]